MSVVFVPDSSNSRSLCDNISITLDKVVEDMEEFLIFISTSDPSVVISQPNASIFIVDSSSKLNYGYIVVLVFFCIKNVISIIYTLRLYCKFALA